MNYKSLETCQSIKITPKLYICIYIAETSGFIELNVIDVDDYTRATKVDVDYIRTECALGATWSPLSGEGRSPLRYDWSVGIKGNPPGNGLLDTARQPVWREAYHDNMAIFTTSSSLLNGTRI